MSNKRISSSRVIRTARQPQKTPTSSFRPPGGFPTTCNSLNNSFEKTPLQGARRVFLPLSSMRTLHSSVTPAHSPRQTPWSKGTGVPICSAFLKKKMSSETPRITLAKKASYALHRPSAQTLFVTQQRAEEYDSELKFSPEILAFLKQLYTDRELLPRDELEKVLVQFLIQKQALFIGIKRLMERELLDLIRLKEYDNVIEYSDELKKSRELSLNEQIVDGICKYAVGEHTSSLQIFETLAQRHPKHAIILYNLGLLQVIMKKYTEGIKTLNTAVGILIKNKGIALLPHAVRLRAVANFESQSFEFAFQDLAFYSKIYQHALQPDNGLIYCQFEFQTKEPCEDNTEKPVIYIRKKRRSEVPARVLFWRKGASTTNIKNKAGVHFSKDRFVVLKPNSCKNASTPLMTSRAEKTNLATSKKLTNKIREAHTERSSDVAHILVEENMEEAKIRFFNRKDRDKVQYQNLKKRVENLRTDFEQKYLAKEEIKKVQDQLFFSVYKVTKGSLINEMQENNKTSRKSLTLAHIEYVKEELFKNSTNRDYDFLDKVLRKLEFLSKLSEPNRLLIFQNCTFEERKANNVLYNEGDLGTIFAIMHQVKTCTQY
eukprot:TRINITY_DN120351_c4_g1_i1.p1 TRINITY_DN120351_c4_g1~~TRINITY_DN120351_c4_g1_i1.p1  ORF type:complete len:629 (-),score=52.51 TRINITY_DN120351_c4_g1_i1:2427-4232(-)